MRGSGNSTQPARHHYPFKTTSKPRRFYYDGDPWEMILHGQPDPYVPTRALPIITVPTLAATGSEMNMAAVISNEETSEKSFVQAECLYPKIALVDPALTVSVPKDHTAYGVCDLITHVTEGTLHRSGAGLVDLYDRVNLIPWDKHTLF